MSHLSPGTAQPRGGPKFLEGSGVGCYASSVCLILLRGQEYVFVFSGLLPHLQKGHSSSIRLKTLSWMKLNGLLCLKDLFVSVGDLGLSALHPVLQGPPLPESTPGIPLIAHPAGLHLLTPCHSSDPVWVPRLSRLHGCSGFSYEIKEQVWHGDPLVSRTLPCSVDVPSQNEVVAEPRGVS